MSSPLIDHAQRYLQHLCLDIATRRVGAAGNRSATDYVAAHAAACGLTVERQDFSCLDWTHGGARLTAGNESFAVQPSPFTLGCRSQGPLAVATSVEELEQKSLEGTIVLLRGDVAREQLMPKNFRFYNPDEHKRIIAALEAARPLAIVAATARNPELAGALYPCPLIEDGDFDIPSVYMTEDEGARLARHAGNTVSLDMTAQRLPSSGCNVVARAGGGPRRLVVCAHIDSKGGTPGALDNAAGVVTLMLLAELLTGYDGRLGVELVAMNGEDYYASCGEIVYLERNRDSLTDIVLAINMDALGQRGGKVAYSYYGCPDALSARVRGVLAAWPQLLEGEQWYQSDHMVFAMSGCPAMAITSQHLATIGSTISHTERDVPDLVDASLLAATAGALHSLLLDLNSMTADSPQGGPQ